jgi:RNA polymerase sigma factor (TIGR02999 family)
MSSAKEVTQLLLDWSNGNKEAVDKLIPLVYNELRRLAERHLRRERPDHTLQTTALVHEAYVRLIDQRSVRWQNQAHFYAIAAQIMRRILVNYARDKRAIKRGGSGQKVSLDEALTISATRGTDMVALDDSLTSLASIDTQQSRIVELRFFGGLTIEETAEVLGISPATVKNKWSMARAWLHREISKTATSDA